MQTNYTHRSHCDSRTGSSCLRVRSTHILDLNPLEIAGFFMPLSSTGQDATLSRLRRRIETAQGYQNLGGVLVMRQDECRKVGRSLKIEYRDCPYRLKVQDTRFSSWESEFNSPQGCHLWAVSDKGQHVWFAPSQRGVSTLTVHQFYCVQYFSRYHEY